MLIGSRMGERVVIIIITITFTVTITITITIAALTCAIMHVSRA
jgi:hypothetical protein